MRIEFSSFVEGDLQAIGDYIAEDSPDRAAAFVREIGAAIRSIGRRPLKHRLRPEIGEDARLAIVGRYVILFRVLERTVRIERVVFGGRDLPSLLA
jgi:toxin ParE1/3/4